jgi:hypothetical protein
VAVTVKVYVPAPNAAGMLTVSVEGTSGPVLVTEAGENENVLGTTPLQPAPVVVAESAAVQLGLELLNVPLN